MTRRRRKKKRSKTQSQQEAKRLFHTEQEPEKPASRIVKIKNFFILIGWCVFSSVFLLVLFEGILRICRFGKDTSLFRQVEYPSGTQGWEPNPDVEIRYFFRPPCPQTQPANNIMRYSFLIDPKSSEEKRVFFLGASTIYGMPPPQNLSIPTLLQSLLDTSYPKHRVQVINCGITALNSHAMVDMAEEILPLDPDLVVLYTGHNEFYGPHGVASTVRYFNQPFLLHLMKQFSHTRLFQLIRRFDPGKRDRSLNSSGTEILFMETMVGKDQIKEGSRDYKWTVSRFQENMDRIGNICQKNNIPLILCTVVSNERDCAPLKPILPQTWNTEDDRTTHNWNTSGMASDPSRTG